MVAMRADEHVDGAVGAAQRASEARHLGVPRLDVGLDDDPFLWDCDTRFRSGEHGIFVVELQADGSFRGIDGNVILR